MDTRKIIQALAYLASKQPNMRIANMKAFKLLWLADRYHLRQYGRTVTGDTYYAMPKGVVPSDAKHILDGKATVMKPFECSLENIISPGVRSYTLVGEPNMKVFSKTDKDALDKVLGLYNGMSADELSQLSHKFPEWKEYESRLKDSDEKNSHKIDMKLFFVNYDDGKGLFTDDKELLSVTENIYRSHYES